MTASQHVIERQYLEIEFETEEEAFGLQEEVSELFKTRVLTAIADTLDRYSQAETVIRIERLDLDIGHVDVEQLDDVFSKKVAEQLDSQVQNTLSMIADSSDTSSVQNVQEKLLELWHHLLQKGHLPWWVSPQSASNLETRLEGLFRSLSQLPAITNQILRANSSRIKRLVYQSSPTIRNRILELLDHTLAAETFSLHDTIVKELTNGDCSVARLVDFERDFWIAAFEECVSPTKQTIKDRMAEILFNTYQASFFESVQNRQTFRDTILSLLESNKESKESNLSSSSWDSLKALMSKVDEIHKTVRDKDDEKNNLVNIALDKSLPDSIETSSETSDGASASIGSSTNNEFEIDEARSDIQQNDENNKRRLNEGSPNKVKPTEINKDVASTLKDAAPASGQPISTDENPETISENTKADDQRTSDQSNVLTAKNPVDPADQSGADQYVDSSGYDRFDSGPSRPLTAQNAMVPVSEFCDGDYIYVDDAGAILLHPFLSTHFEKLGFWKDGSFSNEKSREHAIHQLRFLVTGEIDAPEHSLVLSKIICGLAPTDPIARSDQRDIQGTLEADKLLNAVIKHWGALKSSTPDGLRETFLRREGKLTKKSDEWHLKVETRSYDILLDRLPWILSFVHLPWMPAFLRVEWT